MSLDVMVPGACPQVTLKSSHGSTKADRPKRKFSMFKEQQRQPKVHSGREFVKWFSLPHWFTRDKGLHSSLSLHLQPRAHDWIFTVHGKHFLYPVMFRRFLTLFMANLGCTANLQTVSRNYQLVSAYNLISWVNYNMSLWNKAIWGWFPILTLNPVRSQWGRYSLPRIMCLNTVLWQNFCRIKVPFEAYSLKINYINLVYQTNLGVKKGGLSISQSLMHYATQFPYFIVLWLFIIFRKL